MSTPSRDDVRITVESPRQDELIAMMTEGAAFAAALYPPEDNFLLSVDELERPGVRVSVARDAGGEALGMVALVPLDDGRAEVKRMFVRSVARGRGVARLLLGRVEQDARDAGATSLVLETGPLHTAALALYRSAGFVEIAPFGPYVGAGSSVCFEKVLVDRAAALLGAGEATTPH